MTTSLQVHPTLSVHLTQWYYSTQFSSWTCYYFSSLFSQLVDSSTYILTTMTLSTVPNATTAILLFFFIPILLMTCHLDNSSCSLNSAEQVSTPNFHNISYSTAMFKTLLLLPYQTLISKTLTADFSPFFIHILPVLKSWQVLFHNVLSLLPSCSIQQDISLDYCNRLSPISWVSTSHLFST